MSNHVAFPPALIEELLFAADKFTPGTRTFIEDVQLTWREVYPDDVSADQVEAAIAAAVSAGFITPDKAKPYAVTSKGKKNMFRPSRLAQ